MSSTLLKLRYMADMLNYGVERSEMMDMTIALIPGDSNLCASVRCREPGSGPSRMAALGIRIDGSLAGI